MNSNVFVYGTLMPGERNHRLIESYVHKAWNPIYFDGVMYANKYGSYPYVVEVETPDNEHIVEGVLLQLIKDKLEDAFSILDSLEGHPSHYCRKELPVFTDLWDDYAWVYIAQQPHLFGEVIESGSWREYRKEFVSART